jgi:hypothetical protein
MPFYYQKLYHMADKLYTMTICMDKLKICTSQIFNFWKFVTEIFVKHIERFSKSKKLGKLAIFFAILLPETVSYGRQIIYHDYMHGQVKNMYISEFSFLKLCHRDFLLRFWEIFKKLEIMKIDHNLGHIITGSSRIWSTKCMPSL